MPYSNDTDNMSLHKPLDGYKNIFKDLHNKNVTEKLDSLVLESNIDIASNHTTVKNIRQNEKRRDNLSKTIRNQKSLRTFLIVLIVGLVLMGIYSIYQLTLLIDDILSWVLIPLSMGLLILFIYLITEKINALYKEAWTQMKPLNDLFYEGMSQELFQKTVPLIKMDQMFDSKRLDYLVSKFGLDELDDLKRSTLYV